MAQHILPKLEEIHSAAKMLYGEDTQVNTTETLSDGEIAYVGLLLDDQDVPVAGIACDVSCAVYLGSALSMIPKGGADDAIDSGEPSEMMLSNLNEFMNICSRWFMDANSPHVRLDKTYAVTDLGESARTVLTSEDTLALTLSLPNYGQGKIGCFVT